jgi:hypothetical protein
MVEILKAALISKNPSQNPALELSRKSENRSWTNCKVQKRLVGTKYPTLATLAPNSAERSAEIVEQIKFLLGPSSIQTTERYLGSEQEIKIAVKDNLGW